MDAGIADELAKRQRSISIAEFFEKNRHILGFDSAPKALLNTVKEAVDNALDACEDAGVLPNIFVEIDQRDEGIYRVVVEDNGPGIVGSHIPKTFGKLLYGSRFHTLKQSRGQQGIGISGAVLHAQLSTGTPVCIISKTAPNASAHMYELLINTSTNEPEVIRDEEIEWDRPRGTRVELELSGSYVRARRQSVYEYIRSTAIVNPHARLTLREPDGTESVFERTTDVMPKQPQEIQVHPHGIELGTLLKLVKHSSHPSLEAFLIQSFSSVGRLTAKKMCSLADLDSTRTPSSLEKDEIKRLCDAMHSPSLRIKAPPTECLSPITEPLMREGIRKEYDVDFIATSSRPPSAYRGFPFLVEVALAYGGSLSPDGRASILRFANRVPLLYQQGGCALTRAIEQINWKQYSLSQPAGSVPVGPVLILVHVASVNVPFTAESKEAVADVPEIVREVEHALRDAGRKLRAYLSRRAVLAKRKQKELIIKKLLPLMSKKVCEIVSRPEPDLAPVIAKVMGKVHISRTAEPTHDGHKVRMSVVNHSDTKKTFVLRELTAYPIAHASPAPKSTQVDGVYEHRWQLSLRAGEGCELVYVAKGAHPEHSERFVEGLDEDMLVGARALGGDE
ncbi:MAG: DNA topoisomerase VI subunit B [Methermicoccaceae archaeon]